VKDARERSTRPFAGGSGSLHMIALEEDTTLQARMAEAFNDVLVRA
jgi:hypothetical protein